MYTKTEILKIAKQQLALDYNCQLSDFEKEKNTVVKNKPIEGRRIYGSDGCFLKVLCFGGKAIISTSPLIMLWCGEKLININGAWFLEYENLRQIDNKLQEDRKSVV